MKKLLKTSVAEFMSKKVIAVYEDENIKDLFKLMDKHDILGVPVIDADEKVIGIVTEGDLIEHFTTLKPPRSINLLGSLLYLDDIKKFNENLKDHCAETVKDIMKTEVITIESSSVLLDVINLMSEKQINRLPVIDGKGKLIGIITRSDVVRQLAKLK